MATLPKICSGLVLGTLMVGPALADDITSQFGKIQLSPGWASYASGVSKTAEGDLEQAERLFRKSLEQNPKLAAPLLGLGEVALRRGNRQLATMYFSKALVLEPHNAGVLTAMGRLKAIGNDAPTAEKYFRDAITADRLATAAYLDLGDVYTMIYHKPEEGLKWYRKVLALEPNNAIGHYRAGLVLGDLKQYDAAVAELQAAAVLARENPLPYHALGRLYLVRRDFDSAANAFAKAQQVQPAYVGSYLGRGDALAAKGDGQAALAEYRRATQVAPRYAPAFVRLGMYYQSAGKAQEARSAYLKAIELDGKQAGAYNNLASLAIETGKEPGMAVSWAGNFLFRDTLAWAYHAAGKRDRALPFYQEALDKRVANGEVLYHAGVVFQEGGATAKARLALERAVSLRQNFPGVEDARRRLKMLKP
jgi:superkiller protein 3